MVAETIRKGNNDEKQRLCFVHEIAEITLIALCDFLENKYLRAM